jgi:hypothetical protein
MWQESKQREYQRRWFRNGRIDTVQSDGLSSGRHLALDSRGLVAKQSLVAVSFLRHISRRMPHTSMVHKRLDVTGNVGGNVVGSVGSLSGVTFPANFSGLTITRGRVNADVTHWLGTPAATPTVGGVPAVDITHVLGTEVCH